MKTTLPEKLTHETNNSSGSSELDTKQAINQLITYLAELTEEVEGKENKRYTEIVRGDVSPTPTLKEQLLREIKELDYFHETAGDMVYVKEVQAIINRLIP